jgi:hypothetical protein
LVGNFVSGESLLIQSGNGLRDVRRGFVSAFGTGFSRQGIDAPFLKTTAESKKSSFGDLKSLCDLATLGPLCFGQLTSAKLVKFAIVQWVGEEGLVADEDGPDTFLIVKPHVLADSFGTWRQAPVVGQWPLLGSLRLRDHFPLRKPARSAKKPT